MANGTPGGPLASSKFVLDVLKWIGPVVLAIASGYGAVKFTAGATEQRISNNEVKIAEMQRQLDQYRDRYPTREELKAYIDSIKTSLQDIQDNIRSLRNGR